MPAPGKRPRTEPSAIGNAIKRGEVANAQRAARARDKSARRRDRALARQTLGAAAPAAEVPRTLDNTRELDETVVLPGDAEVAGDEADDEFADIFSGARAPKIMLTTKVSPSGKLFRRIAELRAIVPNAFYYRRGAPAATAEAPAPRRGSPAPRLARAARRRAPPPPPPRRALPSQASTS